MANRIVRHAWFDKPASICLALWLAAGLLAQQAAAASGPHQVAQGFYGVLLSTMRDGRSLGQSGRYARLVPVVNRTFDLAFMARLAVGPSWATLAPAQQQRLTEAFGNYVSATYADRFDSYSGEQLEVTGERPYRSDVIVQTKIVKSNDETTTLDAFCIGGRPAQRFDLRMAVENPIGDAVDPISAVADFAIGR